MNMTLQVALVAAIMGLCANHTLADDPPRWLRPGAGTVFNEVQDFANDRGSLRILRDGEPIDTTDHAFFRPTEGNGRACVSCHQPSDAMGLSVASIRKQWDATEGTDPIFAAYDGSNCPTLPQGERASHSLLLDRGLFRIQRQWPPRDWSGNPATPDFTIEVVRDPTGCNAEPYGPDNGNISVYRRPRPVANLKYLEAMGFAYDPKSGMPLPLDPATGDPVAGNLMADGRVGSLSGQIDDATSTHLELTENMSGADKAEILDFIRSVYAAQQVSNTGGALDDGAAGGPATLRDSTPGQLGSIGRAIWSEFAGWQDNDDPWRRSVARGAKMFRERTFLITDSAGINGPVGFGNPVRNGCAFCHNMSQMGNDVAPGQVDLGTTTEPFADPRPDLPLFRITCDTPHPFYGKVIHTTDPGYALTTGKCADVGKITLQSNRGLAARAPYFANGSAATIEEVIDYYDRRYGIGYTEQERQDMINLLEAL